MWAGQKIHWPQVRCWTARLGSLRQGATRSERAQAPTLEYTVHFPRDLPVAGELDPDWTLVRLVTDEATDGHFSEDGELWSRNGTLLARCRQIALLRYPKEQLS